jgi:hypothetical protein
VTLAERHGQQRPRPLDLLSEFQISRALLLRQAFAG